MTSPATPNPPASAPDTAPDAPTTPVDAPAGDRLTERYGGAPPPGRPGGAGLSRRARRALTGAFVLFATAAVAAAAWSAKAGSTGGIGWMDRQITVVNDDRTDVRFEVTAPVGTRVVCTVRVLDRGRADVGRLEVPAGPSEEGTFLVTAQVPTAVRGQSATVQACAPAP